jgi:hypothetical protein
MKAPMKEPEGGYNLLVNVPETKAGTTCLFRLSKREVASFLVGPFQF